VILGDEATGKTALLDAFVTGTTAVTAPPGEKHVGTVLDYCTASIDSCQLQIFDTGGEKDCRGHRVRSCLYPNTSVVLVCFSIVDRDSLRSVEDFWVPEICRRGDGHPPFLLVGTQRDLREDQATVALLWANRKERPVSATEGATAASKLGAVGYVECSAATHSGIRDVFATASAATPSRKPPPIPPRPAARPTPAPRQPIRSGTDKPQMLPSGSGLLYTVPVPLTTSKLYDADAKTGNVPVVTAALQLLAPTVYKFGNNPEAVYAEALIEDEDLYETIDSVRTR